MEYVIMLLLAISLSLDTFSLSLAMGMSFTKEEISKNKIKVPLVLAVIQAGMYCLGDILENTIINKLTFLNNFHISSIIFLILAYKLYTESKKSEEFNTDSYSIYKIGLLTSIDALIIGLLNLEGIYRNIELYGLIVIITFIFSFMALIIVKRLKRVNFIEDNSLLIASILMAILAVLSF